MAKKNWFAKLAKLEGAVVDDYNPFAHTLWTPSPSCNFIYGNSWGLPRGYTQVLFGEPKSGKTVYANAMVGQMHRDDEEGVALKFDTELRERGQMTDDQARCWGVDKSRYLTYSVNSPAMIFDRIEKEIAAECEAGMPLRLVVIDSVNGVQGRRAENADSINVQQIGDLAQTLGDGFKRILPIQRKYNFAILLAAHVRAEMDPLEIRRGNKVKMGLAFAVKHYAEYFTFVERLRTKEGKTDLLGNTFEDKSLTDADDNADRTGHKIRVTMKDSSFGCEGRTGVFTYDHKRGIINTHEEIFLLGANRGIIERPTNSQYAFGDKKWNGKPAMLEALRTNPDLAKEVLQAVRAADMEHKFDGQDAAKGLGVEVDD
jgi:RecA/RadA recombinase